MLTVSVCPLTMGAVTSMTDAGFNRSCRMRNKDQDVRNGYGSSVGTSTIYDEYCKQCGGEYPPELTIIKLEEIDMGTVTSYQGTCEMCLKPERSLRKVLDKKCCSTCEHIRRAARKSPELLAAALKDANKGGIHEQLEEINIEESNDYKTLEFKLHVSDEHIKALTGIKETLIADYAALEQVARELRECNNDLQTERMEILNKNLSLIQEIEQLKQATLWVPEEEALAISSGFCRYDALKDVLRAALTQAEIGKGKERHANDEPFEEQDICAITRSEGHGFTRGQAIKKIKEAKRLDRDAAIRELLGAINYLAADVIVLGEVA